MYYLYQNRYTIIIMFLIILFTTIDVKANPQIVVPKLTSSCPSGYRQDNNSGYCIINNKNYYMIIPKLKLMCPSGYRQDNNSGYCISTKYKRI